MYTYQYKLTISEHAVHLSNILLAGNTFEYRDMKPRIYYKKTHIKYGGGV